MAGNRPLTQQEKERFAANYISLLKNIIQRNQEALVAFQALQDDPDFQVSKHLISKIKDIQRKPGLLQLLKNIQALAQETQALDPQMEGFNKYYISRMWTLVELIDRLSAFYGWERNFHIKEHEVRDDLTTYAELLSQGRVPSAKREVVVAPIETPVSIALNFKDILDIAVENKLLKEYKSPVNEAEFRLALVEIQTKSDEMLENFEKEIKREFERAERDNDLANQRRLAPIVHKLRGLKIEDVSGQNRLAFIFNQLLVSQNPHTMNLTSLLEDFSKFFEKKAERRLSTEALLRNQVSAGEEFRKVEQHYRENLARETEKKSLLDIEKSLRTPDVEEAMRMMTPLLISAQKEGLLKEYPENEEFKATQFFEQLKELQEGLKKMPEFSLFQDAKPNFIPDLPRLANGHRDPKILLATVWHGALSTLTLSDPRQISDIALHLQSALRVARGGAEAKVIMSAPKAPEKKKSPADIKKETQGLEAIRGFLENNAARFEGREKGYLDAVLSFLKLPVANEKKAELIATELMRFANDVEKDYFLIGDIGKLKTPTQQILAIVHFAVHPVKNQILDRFRAAERVAELVKPTPGIRTRHGSF